MIRNSDLYLLSELIISNYVPTSRTRVGVLFNRDTKTLDLTPLESGVRYKTPDGDVIDEAADALAKNVRLSLEDEQAHKRMDRSLLHLTKKGHRLAFNSDCRAKVCKKVEQNGKWVWRPTNEEISVAEGTMSEFIYYNEQPYNVYFFVRLDNTDQTVSIPMKFLYRVFSDTMEMDEMSNEFCHWMSTVSRDYTNE